MAPTVINEGVRQAVLLGIAYVPAAMSVLAVFILSFYRLDEATLERIRAERTATLQASALTGSRSGE